MSQASLAMGALLLLLPACAVTWHDSETGTDHIWGFGHLMVRAQAGPEATQAVATAAESVGFTLAAGEQDRGLILGWHRRERLIVLARDAAFALLRPHLGSSLMTVRLGGLPPGPESAAPAPTDPPPEGDLR